MLMLSFIAICSCGQQKKESESKAKKVVCDSVQESVIDANGNESITTKFRCDTLYEQ